MLFPELVNHQLLTSASCPLVAQLCRLVEETRGASPACSRRSSRKSLTLVFWINLALPCLVESSPALSDLIVSLMYSPPLWLHSPLTSSGWHRCCGNCPWCGAESASGSHQAVCPPAYVAMLLVWPCMHHQKQFELVYLCAHTEQGRTQYHEHQVQSNHDVRRPIPARKISPWKTSNDLRRLKSSGVCFGLGSNNQYSNLKSDLILIITIPKSIF